VSKNLRMRRLVNVSSKRTCIVPMDHGGYAGPMPGIESMADAIRGIIAGGADALLLQKGILKACPPETFGNAGIIMRVSVAAEYFDETFEYITSSCEEAVRLGADGVAMTVYVGTSTDSKAFRLFGKLVDAADKWGLPIMGEFVPAKNRSDIMWVKRCARIGAELGADMIKTSYGKPFREVIETCPVPVVVMGGEKMTSTREVLEIVYDAVRSGALGTCIGRNTFQHKHPTAMTRAISGIVHEQISVEEALRIAERDQ
jgi:DhnA family fructose-bisphosphate aldolase class Ia